MYTISYPQGILRKEGVEIEQNDQLPAYQEYVKWLSQGNGPQEVHEPVYPRVVVSAWQIRKALNALGLRQAVEDAVVASGNIEMQDGWNYAPQFYSDLPLSLSLGSQLGIDREGMYNLFKLAESL